MERDGTQVAAPGGARAARGRSPGRGGAAAPTDTAAGRGARPRRTARRLLKVNETQRSYPRAGLREA